MAQIDKSKEELIEEINLLNKRIAAEQQTSYLGTPYQAGCYEVERL